MKFNRFIVSAALLLVTPACENHSSLSAVTAAGITSRTSMGGSDPFQCQSNGQLKYTGSQKVNGYWIAGVDGNSFGSTHDGVTPGSCGTVFTITNTQSGNSEKFILADRVWMSSQGPA